MGFRAQPAQMVLPLLELFDLFWKGQHPGS